MFLMFLDMFIINKANKKRYTASDRKKKNYSLIATCDVCKTK